MDSPSDANKQIIPVSGEVVSKEEPSVDAGQSSESAVAVVAPPPSPSSPPAHDHCQLAIANNDRDYGCQYCKKRFGNKQALGGHQNAHKVERLMVKNLQEYRNNLDYFKSSSSSYLGRPGAGGPPLTSFKHRYSPYSLGCNGHHHGGGSAVIPYNSRPLLPPFPGWPAPPPAPTMGPFPGRPHYTLAPLVQNLNIRLPNFGAGSSNPGAGQGRPAGGNNAAPPVNLRNVPEPEEDDDSGLDLSLKLSYD